VVYADNTSGPIEVAVPFTWASGDALTATLTYIV